MAKKRTSDLYAVPKRVPIRPLAGLHLAGRSAVLLIGAIACGGCASSGGQMPAERRR